MADIEQAREAYFAAFGDPGPQPFGVSDEVIALRLSQAVDAGEPVPPEFDWWALLPDGAVA